MVPALFLIKLGFIKFTFSTGKLITTSHLTIKRVYMGGLRLCETSGTTSAV